MLGAKISEFKFRITETKILQGIKVLMFSLYLSDVFLLLMARGRGGTLIYL